jgi:hypothetical protein
MAISVKTAKIVLIKSGNRCAVPGCGERLTEPATAEDEAALIGQIAHIVSEADEGPRADPAMPLAERNAEPNLVALCPKHHRIADQQENTYTVDEMRAWKDAHEALVDSQMESVVGQLTFTELELVADAVMATSAEATSGFQLTDIRPKMAKNQLTDRVSRDIATGMLGADVVKDYVARRALMAPDFPDRLRGGFLGEYDRLYGQGLRGDELFLALRSFAAPAHTDLNRQTAGLAVLVHLFRICELFEP